MSRYYVKTDLSQLTTTNELNFPGYKDGVTGPEMMVGEAQAKRFETDV